jgi:hypothetical protein
MNGIKRGPVTDNEVQNIDRIKEYPDSFKESLPTCDRVNVKQEVLLQPFAFVSVKHEAVSTPTYNKILSGYQPRQMVEWRKNQRFEDYLRPRPQVTLKCWFFRHSI